MDSTETDRQTQMTSRSDKHIKMQVSTANA